MTDKMTSEEALKKVRGYLTDYLPLEDADEIDEIIEALEPSTTPSYNSIKTELKPCEDYISREEAKKLIQGKIDDIPKNKDGTYGSMFGQYVNGLYCAKTAISYMSSVVPQTKRGNWIETSLTPISGGDFNRGFKCSCCDYVTVVDDFNFCPNCGAKMEVEE